MASVTDPLRREVTTMALYVAVVLLATIAAIPAEDLEDDGSLAASIWGAAAGLAVAHWFAFHVSATLYAGGDIPRSEIAVGAAQVGAALAVAMLATLPSLVFDDQAGTGVAAALLIAVIAAVGYISSRRAGGSPAGAVLRAGATVAVGAVVVAIKVSLNH